MKYHKQDSYISRAKGWIGTGVLLASLGLGTILGSPSPAYGQEAPKGEAKENLIERIKKYQINIKNYQVTGNSENAAKERKKLEQEILTTETKTLEQSIQILELTKYTVSTETILDFLQKQKPKLSGISPLKLISALEAFYTAVDIKNPRESYDIQLRLLLNKLTYAYALESAADKNQKPKYSQEIPNIQTQIKNIYSGLTEKEKKEAIRIVEPYGMADFLQKTVEQKPEEKKPEDAKAKQEQQKPEEPKIPAIPPVQLPEPKIVVKPKTRPAYNGHLEGGHQLNSNKSTQGQRLYSSLISQILNAQGFHEHNTWEPAETEKQEDMLSQSKYGANISIKPFGITKIAELFGLEVPDEVINAIEASATYSGGKKIQRTFNREITADSEFEITTDEATKETTTPEYMATSASMTLPFMSASISVTGFQETESTSIDVQTLQHHKNLSNPLADYDTEINLSLEQMTETRGIQAEARYEHSSTWGPGGKRCTFKASLGMLGDFSLIKQEFPDRTSRTLEHLLVGITGRGTISEHFAFNFAVIPEKFAGPGKENDGWQANGTKGFASLALRTGLQRIEYGDNKTADLTAAIFGMGWYQPEGRSGAAAGFIAGTGCIDINKISDIVNALGRERLGLRRDLGTELSAFERERLFRTIPIQLCEGLNIWAYGGQFGTKDQNNERARAVFGHAGMSFWKIAINGAYLDDKTERRIGGQVYADFNSWRLLLGFFHSQNLLKKDDSFTGEIGMAIPY